MMGDGGRGLELNPSFPVTSHKLHLEDLSRAMPEYSVWPFSLRGERSRRV